MGVRLILVSLVAGLGLTIPSASQVKQWTESAQNWVYTHLAEMDARMPADQSAFVFVADGPSVLADEPAAIVENETAPIVENAQPAPTEPSAPSASALADAQKLADELAAGLEIPYAPVAVDEPAAAPAPAPAPSPVTVAVETPAPVINDDAFLKAQSDVIASFIADAAVKPTPVETPKALVAETVATPVEPIVWTSDISNDPDQALAQLVADAFAGVPEAVVAAPPAAPSVEPIVVQDMEASDLAFLLKTDTDWLNAPAAPIVPPVVSAPAVEEARPDLSGRVSQLGHAVRLTREAVYAWANLLHGPAVVTIAH